MITIDESLDQKENPGGLLGIKCDKCGEYILVISVKETDKNDSEGISLCRDCLKKFSIAVLKYMDQ